MTKAIEALLTFVLFVAWLAGIVLAQGFWGTAAAVCLVFPAWYNVVERLMQMWGIV